MHVRLCFVCIVSLVYDIHVIYTSDIHHTILTIVLGQIHFIVNDQQNSELLAYFVSMHILIFRLSPTDKAYIRNNMIKNSSILTIKFLSNTTSPLHIFFITTNVYFPYITSTDIWVVVTSWYIKHFGWINSRLIYMYVV